MSYTNAQVAALVKNLEAKFDAAIAQAPATAKPKTAKAKSVAGPTKFADTEFGQKQLARAAAKIPCELGHGDACNRRFSPTSEGRTTHVARIV